MSRLTRLLTFGREREGRSALRSWDLNEEGRANVEKVRAFVEARENATPLTDEDQAFLKAGCNELKKADDLLRIDLQRRTSFGSLVTAAQIHLNAARLFWLRSFLSSPDKFAPYLPGLRADIEEHLEAGDPRRLAVEAIVPDSLTDKDLVKILDAVEVAHGVALREKLRASSFVRIVLRVAAFLFLLAVSVAVLTAVWKDAVPLCFNPPQTMQDAGVNSPVDYTVVCPAGSDEAPQSQELDENFRAVASSGDYILVEVVGLVAAGVAAASALRKIRGTSTPYQIPVALAALKLPAGALTAVLGLLLMRGGFVPGLSALDSSAQIIAWAIIFGYSQELFTKFVDKRGQMVLDSVRGPASPPPAEDWLPMPAAGTKRKAQ
ncbi:hypothetical protein [Streptomyces sp. CC208A]|uniref:hypothetical protein n=1 Tax=Streptomyces sp. CC208A TaxID=3044573 RepID=UPI0024A93DD6|nr:hypothetical protein [Streptomyces sp. CC208A]